MSEDPRIEEAKKLLDAINIADVAEDAAFQLQIDSLSSSLTTITAELDTSNALLAATVEERNELAAEKATTLVELRAILDSITARIAALESK